MSTFVAQLRALSAAATPGPWRDCHDPAHFDTPAIGSASFSYYISKIEDARLIAYLRNHADAIAEALEALEMIAQYRRPEYSARDWPHEMASEALARLNGEGT